MTGADVVADAAAVAVAAAVDTKHEADLFLFPKLHAPLGSGWIHFS